jgi:hypothetical protein
MKPFTYSHSSHMHLYVRHFTMCRVVLGCAGTWHSCFVSMGPKTQYSDFLSHEVSHEAEYQVLSAYTD